MNTTECSVGDDVVYRCCYFYCSECPFNCLTCLDSGDGVPTMICKSCNYQYVLNEGDCGACPRYCLKCTASKNGLTCIQCQNKTTMMPDGTCERTSSSLLL